MEDEDDILGLNICQECGLPLLLYSYETKEINKDSEIIYISLFCRISEHKEIKKYDFENYYNNIIINNYQSVCKCTICNNFIKDEKIVNYCYTCKKVVCTNCKNNFHEKSHENIFKYTELLKEKKCFSHLGNVINYYCLECKKGMCKLCFLEEINHDDKENYQTINNLKSYNQNMILILQKEQEYLLKKIKLLENKKNFNEFLMKDDNCFLYKNYINNYSKTFCKSLKPNENPINIIYYNENLNIINKIVHIIEESEYFEQKTKGTLILTRNLNEFKLVLQFLEKIKSKSKFFLIINGRASEKVIDFINKNNNYKEYFISCCLFTMKKGNYKKIKEDNPNFIKRICTQKDEVCKYLSHPDNSYNETLKINPNINLNSYKSKYFILHKELSLFYGDETEKVFTDNCSIIEEFIEKENFPNKKQLKEAFRTFPKIKNNNYERIIKHYLNNNYLGKILYISLNTKEINKYKKIGYFVSYLMHCIVQYGKKNKKGVNSPKTFYSGITLNIIEILDFFKNLKNKITFPYFLYMTTKEELAESSSKRTFSEKEREKYNFFSVIITIKYLYKDEYEPSCFELKDLSQHPEEQEYIALPFTFYSVEKVDINCEKYTCDIELNVIGKKEILENKIKEPKKAIDINQENVLSIMEVENQKI